MVSGFRQVKLDDVATGTMVYSMSRMPLGVVRGYQTTGGHPQRHLDNGSRKDRFAYRRKILYSRVAGENGGIVLVKGEPE